MKAVLVVLVSIFGFLSVGSPGVHWHVDEKGRSHPHSHGLEDVKSLAGKKSEASAVVKRAGQRSRAGRGVFSARRMQWPAPAGFSAFACCFEGQESSHLKHIATIRITI